MFFFHFASGMWVETRWDAAGHVRRKKVRCHQLHTYACKGRDSIIEKKSPMRTIQLQYALGLKIASKWMHHRKERARKPRKPLRFEEEPCSWTVHVAVRDSIERELMYTPLFNVDSPGARAHTKAESFLRLLDMLVQILDR